MSTITHVLEFISPRLIIRILCLYFDFLYSSSFYHQVHVQFVEWMKGRLRCHHFHVSIHFSLWGIKYLFNWLLTFPTQMIKTSVPTIAFITKQAMFQCLRKCTMNDFLWRYKMNASKRNNVVLQKICRSVQKNTSCEKIVRKGKIFNIKKKLSASDKT